MGQPSTDADVAGIAVIAVPLEALSHLRAVPPPAAPLDASVPARRSIAGGAQAIKVASPRFVRGDVPEGDGRPGEDRVEACQRARGPEGARRGNRLLDRRLVAILPLLTKETVQLFWPPLVPMGVALVGFLLINVGMAEPKAVESEPAKPMPQREPAKDPPTATKREPLGLQLEGAAAALLRL